VFLSEFEDTSHEIVRECYHKSKEGLKQP